MEDKSIKIETNIGSSLVSGHTVGNISSQVQYSFNTYTQEQKQNLCEAAAEIQKLLEYLEQSYPTETTSGKMAVATETIKHIESNPTLSRRIISALKTGGVKAFEQFLSHPAASFVIGALEDWEKTRGNQS
ncbi:hypothetical protein NIES37_63930 [Tolypothrix tenuis PCC 7101]|uniref:Pentapeptide repeat protein n=1 Tax=Tolypothrix tenuis PCC 7101 TaxID=231146 RepID=A0A1Z4N9J7_9CYAN|nr:hypothetical protein [Aulosira sp. FACHB-113]BAZ02381.1 hypothetical protein NIES37_63930 [Tolypothrix tenuis PCC 7101]BAZ73698.1 hypothetical protein NIES50_22640 [Aulosira laxa NIES-50]